MDQQSINTHLLFGVSLDALRFMQGCWQRMQILAIETWREEGSPTQDLWRNNMPELWINSWRWYPWLLDMISTNIGYHSHRHSSRHSYQALQAWISQTYSNKCCHPTLMLLYMDCHEIIHLSTTCNTKSDMFKIHVNNLSFVTHVSSCVFACHFSQTNPTGMRTNRSSSNNRLARIQNYTERKHKERREYVSLKQFHLFKGSP